MAKIIQCSAMTTRNKAGGKKRPTASPKATKRDKTAYPDNRPNAPRWDKATALVRDFSGRNQALLKKLSHGEVGHVKNYYDGKRKWEELTKNEQKWILNDKNKNELAKRKGFKLIRIWENEEDLVWRIN